MRCALRDFTPADADAVNRIAVAAFRQYRDRYDDWEVFSRHLAAMASLADTAELVVATADGSVVAAVAYVGPGRPRASYFAPDWAVLRMLVVEPAFRGRGIGRALADECLRRAARDGATAMALHTSPIMEIALAMYLRMGFAFLRSVEPIYGVPYGIYVKTMNQGNPGETTTTDH